MLGSADLEGEKLSIVKRTHTLAKHSVEYLAKLLTEHTGSHIGVCGLRAVAADLLWAGSIIISPKVVRQRGEKRERGMRRRSLGAQSSERRLRPPPEGGGGLAPNGDDTHSCPARAS